MKIKSGDNIIVITGKDKGLTGKVLKAFPRENKIIVEGVNIKKRHQKARREGQKGQIIETAYPMHVSNVKKAGEEDSLKPKVKKEAKPKVAKKASKKAETK